MKLFVKLMLCSTLLASTLQLQAQTKSEVLAPLSATIQKTDTLSLSNDKYPAGWIKTGEYSIQNPETGNWETQDAYGPAPKSLFQLYEEGGYIWMSAITICLIGMLFAAWKAPRWIKEIGLLALILGVYSFLLGINDMSEILSSLEIGKEISSCLLFGGLRAALITPMYGLIVYGISLFLRIALKPRI